MSTGFAVEHCRRYGIHAQTARQVEQTYQQILDIAQRQRLADGPTRETNTPPAHEAATPARPDEGLLRSLMVGFVDQLCARRDQGRVFAQAVARYDVRLRQTLRDR